MKKKKLFISAIFKVSLCLCFFCFLSCSEEAKFVGTYTGTTVDDLGEDIGAVEVTFITNLKEDNTFTEVHFLTSDEGESLAEVTISGEWGVSETELIHLRSSDISIPGNTIWRKYDLNTMILSSEEYADELTPAYKQLFANENKELKDADRINKVYGWVNVELQGDSLIHERTKRLIAIRINDNK